MTNGDAIAAFHINDDAKEEALRRGYFVLQRCGDLVHSESSDYLTVLYYRVFNLGIPIFCRSETPHFAYAQ